MDTKRHERMISSQRLVQIWCGSELSYTSCAFYTMIDLIFEKNQVKSIIEIGLAGGTGGLFSQINSYFFVTRIMLQNFAMFKY